VTTWSAAYIQDAIVRFKLHQFYQKVNFLFCPLGKSEFQIIITNEISNFFVKTAVIFNPRNFFINIQCFSLRVVLPGSVLARKPNYPSVPRIIVFGLLIVVAVINSLAFFWIQYKASLKEKIGQQKTCLYLTFLPVSIVKRPKHDLPATLTDVIQLPRTVISRPRLSTIKQAQLPSTTYHLHFEFL
jgi:hypothetical protein